LGPGQIFAEEVILLKAGKLDVSKIQSMSYTVTCKEIECQALIFFADELFNIIKHDDKTVIEEIKRSYWNKLPMPRDN